jgi:hypothetical protein
LLENRCERRKKTCAQSIQGLTRDHHIQAEFGLNVESGEHLPEHFAVLARYADNGPECAADAITEFGYKGRKFDCFRSCAKDEE